MLYVISKLCLRFSTIVCDTQFTLVLFFLFFWTNVQSKRTTRAEPEGYLWSADHSLRNAGLHHVSNMESCHTQYALIIEGVANLRYACQAWHVERFSMARWV